MRVGFIGLGRMGGPMAARIVAGRPYRSLATSYLFASAFDRDKAEA